METRGGKVVGGGVRGGGCVSVAVCDAVISLVILHTNIENIIIISVVRVIEACV